MPWPWRPPGRPRRARPGQTKERRRLRPRTGKGRAERSGRSAGRSHAGRCGRRASGTYRERAEVHARLLPLDVAAAGLVSYEAVTHGLPRLRLERDVVLVQVHLAVLIAGDVDRDVVAHVRLQLSRAHLLGAGHRKVEGHVLAALVLVGVDEHATGDDEDDDERNDDQSASSAHAISSFLM